jgi:hypothetical protein
MTLEYSFLSVQYVSCSARNIPYLAFVSQMKSNRNISGECPAKSDKNISGARVPCHRQESWF